jgi:hypothetical protein
MLDGSPIPTNAPAVLVACTLKRWLSGLDGEAALIPARFYQQMVAAAKSPPPPANGEERRMGALWDALQPVLSQLPPLNRHRLAFLAHHLKSVAEAQTQQAQQAEQAEQQRQVMGVSNLCIVFAPTLLRAPIEGAEGVAAAQLEYANISAGHHQRIIEVLISHADEIGGTSGGA